MNLLPPVFTKPLSRLRERVRGLTRANQDLQGEIMVENRLEDCELQLASRQTEKADLHEACASYA